MASKKAETNDIKQILGVLCKHINKLFNLGMKPEHFRQAKFDKSDADVMKKMWRLLNVLTVHNYVPVVKDIKEYFRGINYSCASFYELPEDMSSGSRELLIAATAVLNEGLVTEINKCLENSPYSGNFEILNEVGDIPIRRLDTSHIKTRSDSKNYQKWLEGKIKNNQNLISEYETHNSKLLSQLKEDVYVDVDSLSFLEICALNSQKYADVYLRESEDVIEVLQNHENWVRKAGIFWKWMITVLEERNKSKTNAH